MASLPRDPITRRQPKKSNSVSKRMGAYTNTKTVIDGCLQQRKQAARSYVKYPSRIVHFAEPV